VRQVRKAATNVSNVITYVAVVSFANRDNRLLPGMTANVRVVTESRTDVLKVPNAALRVRLPDAEAASGARPAGQRGAGGRGGRVYLLDAQGKPQAVPVGTGVSDGSFTEIVVKPDTPGADRLVEGATVVTGVSGGAANGSGASAPARATGLRLPF